MAEALDSNPSQSEFESRESYGELDRRTNLTWNVSARQGSGFEYRALRATTKYMEDRTGVADLS